MTDEQQAAALQAMSEALQAAAWYGIALNPVFPARDRLDAALKALDYYENALAEAWDEGYDSADGQHDDVGLRDHYKLTDNPYRTVEEKR